MLVLLGSAGCADPLLSLVLLCSLQSVPHSAHSSVWAAQTPACLSAHEQIKASCPIFTVLLLWTEMRAGPLVRHQSLYSVQVLTGSLVLEPSAKTQQENKSGFL